MKTVAVRLLLALGLVFPSLLVAQAPTVTAVINQGSRDAPISPGVLALVQGSNFASTAIVTVGGLPAPVFEHIDAVPNERIKEGLQIQLPVELTAGETTLVVTTFAGSSEPFDIILQDFGPALSGFIDRSIPAPAVFSCFPAKTAMPGDMVTVSAIGLGATDPVVPTGMAPFSTVPTVTMPSISVGGQAAEVLESILSPDDVGVYWVTFRIPPAVGGHDVVLTIGGATSNREFLPVGTSAINFSSAWRRGVAAPESIRILRACGVPFREPAEPDSMVNSPSFAADTLDPPTTLGGVTVRVTDSGGVERMAPLLYVAPFQINYVVPAGTLNGYATVWISDSEGRESGGTVEIQSVAPALFGAALVVRFRDGVQTVETVYPPIAAADGILQNAPLSDDGEPLDGLPIDLGPDTDQVYLVLFGTGLRFRSSTATVGVNIGGENALVDYVGAQNEFAGLDQLNVGLPRALAGRGEAELQLTVDGNLANTMYLTFR